MALTAVPLLFVLVGLTCYIVVGFLVAGAYAFGRLRGRWGRYERVALTVSPIGEFA